MDAADAATAAEAKVVLLGDAGVGKTSIVLRFVTGAFERYSESTIGYVIAVHACGCIDHVLIQPCVREWGAVPVSCRKS